MAPERAAGPRPTVVFDFAGVVFNWQPLALLQQVLPQHAVDLASARHWAAEIFQGYSGDWAEFDRGTVAPADLVQRIARRTGLAPAAVQAVVEAVPQALQPLPGTVALIERLHARGRPLYFLSNMPRPYADHLERCNAFMADFADGIFSCRVGLMKPHAAIFELAERRFGIDPANTLFIDDHAGNVAAARRRGWQALQFADAGQCSAEMQALGW